MSTKPHPIIPSPTVLETYFSSIADKDPEPPNPSAGKGTGTGTGAGAGAGAGPDAGVGNDLTPDVVSRVGARLPDVLPKVKLHGVVPPYRIRLHMPGIPHTITSNRYSHCAFTGKVLRFAPMMRSVGYEVYHYGTSTPESGANKDIDLFTVAEFETLRAASYQVLHPEVDAAEASRLLQDPKAFVGDLGNVGLPLYKEFNIRFRRELAKHYRSTATDIVCLPFGLAHHEAVKDTGYVFIETGIGYPDSFHTIRVFESHAWMHHTLGKLNKPGQVYWFVAPNYFNRLEWPLSLAPVGGRVGVFGRITHIKGMLEVVECARRMPGTQFILCGQGHPAQYLTEPNIEYWEPLHGTHRAEFLGSLTALLAPSKFVEPFCGVAVEAQMCGTPVMTHDFGAQTETVEHGKTGMLCHTLADFCLGIRMASRHARGCAQVRLHLPHCAGHSSTL
jgi:glycosyltransferase involved in cell wall biosynthesis